MLPKTSVRLRTSKYCLIHLKPHTSFLFPTNLTTTCIETQKNTSVHSLLICLWPKCQSEVTSRRQNIITTCKFSQWPKGYSTNKKINRRDKSPGKNRGGETSMASWPVTPRKRINKLFKNGTQQTGQ